MRHTVKLDAIQDDGICNSWSTDINGDKASVVLYFMSNRFNLGREADMMADVHRITFSDGTTVARCPNPKCFEAHIESKMVRGSINVVCMALNKGE